MRGRLRRTLARTFLPPFSLFCQHYNGLGHKKLMVFLTSTTVGRDLISRAFGVSPTLDDHPRLGEHEDLVLRSLASLRDEDLRFLGILSRRMLESLDI